MNNCESFLDGQTVLVTRAEPLPGSVDSLAKLLTTAGAAVVACPVIELSMAKNIGPAETAVGDINRYGAVVFASSNGAYFFSQLIDDFAVSPAMISNAVDVVAIGNGTAATLKHFGYDSVSHPDSADSHSLADWLIANIAPPYLIVRADRGSTVLATELARHGKHFREIVVYESSDVLAIDSSMPEKLVSGEVDWVTLTSSAIANSAVRLFGESLHNTKLVTLSPQISEVLRAEGYEVSAEAEEANFPSLVKAIQAATN